MDIKCIIHTGYGRYGYGIMEEVYNHIKTTYGKDIADNFLEVETKIGDKVLAYRLKDRSDNSRFNPILVDAFEQDDYGSNYVVRRGFFETDNYDGSERNARLIFI